MESADGSRDGKSMFSVLVELGFEEKFFRGLRLRVDFLVESYFLSKVNRGKRLF